MMNKYVLLLAVLFSNVTFFYADYNALKEVIVYEIADPNRYNQVLFTEKLKVAAVIFVISWLILSVLRFFSLKLINWSGSLK